MLGKEERRGGIKNGEGRIRRVKEGYKMEKGKKEDKN